MHCIIIVNMNHVSYYYIVHTTARCVIPIILFSVTTDNEFEILPEIIQSTTEMMELRLQAKSVR